MQKGKEEIFTMRYIKAYKNSLKRRKEARRLCILLYPVLLLTVGYWSEDLPEILLPLYTALFFFVVFLILLSAERYTLSAIKVAVGERNTIFHFPCDENTYLEYAFANDYTAARKRAVFHPFHVEVIVQGKGRRGVICEGEIIPPDEILLRSKDVEEKYFSYAMDTTLCFFIPSRELKKAEEKVPFLMGLHKEL